MGKKYHALLGLLVATLLTGLLHAQSQDRRLADDGTPSAALGSPINALTTSQDVRVPKVSRPPRLEDFIEGAPREAEATITDLRQRAPGDGNPISQSTTAYLSYDPSNLYVVFVCKDDVGKVRAQMAKREDTADDDSVGIYLDTFHDRQHAYYFSSNPYGIQTDGLIAEGDKSADTTFDTLWQSRGQLTPDGFVVWMAIPFKSLRFSHNQEQTWGIALTRTMLRTGETAFWPYITSRKGSFLDQFANLEGLSLITPSRNMQLIPYATGTAARIPNTAANSYRTEQDARGGVDSKVVIRDAVTWDVTINPDFSQVESDDPQVTVNKRYEVYFPEKRPFFIEDAGYFSTPINLLFTRNIVDPQFGTRLTGRMGRWSVGALAIDDRAPGKLVDLSDPHYGEHAVMGITRVQKDFASQSQFGVLFSNWTFGSGSNQVVSFDTHIKLSPTWFFTGQIVRTFDREPKANGTLNRLKGNAYTAALSHSDRHFSYTSTYNDLSPDFSTQLGFIPRVDIRQGQSSAGYFWRPEGRSVLDYGVSDSVNSVWNHHGQLQDLNSYLQFQMDFTRRTGFSIIRYDAYERYGGAGFQYGYTGGSFYANWLRWLFLSGSYNQGTGLNYYPASGVGVFIGNTQTASFNAKLKFNSRLRMDETYYLSHLGTQPGLQIVPAQSGVFTDHLLRTKLNYQFTTAWSLRGILDYDALLSNPRLFGQNTTKRLTGDVLLTYLINPGTALYLGYNNSYENLIADPSVLPGVRRFGPPTYLTGRQIFVKLTYRLRL
jgi:hypothetical protein